MVDIHVERTIEAPPEKVFDWLADPVRLTAAPLILKAGWATDSAEPGVGAVRTATGVGMRFREELTAYDAPRSYSYRIVGSFPAFDHEGGTVTLTPSGTGTHVDWRSTYTHPVRAGGRVLQLASAPLLRWNFVAILARCAQELER